MKRERTIIGVSAVVLYFGLIACFGEGRIERPIQYQTLQYNYEPHILNEAERENMPEELAERITKEYWEALRMLRGEDDR